MGVMMLADHTLISEYLRILTSRVQLLDSTCQGINRVVVSSDMYNVTKVCAGYYPVIIDTKEQPEVLLHEKFSLKIDVSSKG